MFFKWIYDYRYNLIFVFLNDKVLYLCNNNNYLVFYKYYFKFIKNRFKLYNLHYFVKKYMTNYVITVKLHGLGFIVTSNVLDERILEFNLGFSHKILVKIPSIIKYHFLENNNVLQFSCDNCDLLHYIVSRLLFLKKMNKYNKNGIYIYNNNILKKNFKKSS